MKKQESIRLKIQMINGIEYVPVMSRKPPDKNDPKAPPTPPPILITEKINPKDLPMKISAAMEGKRGAAAP
jgi:hypothetical protein